MGAAYQAAVQARAPQAQKVFDRFHVQKLASEAVDSVRRQEANLQGSAEKAQALKHSRWALLKNPWNLTQRQEQKLSEVARTNRRLYRAYLLNESLAKGLDYRQRQRAEQHLDGWAQWASLSRLSGPHGDDLPVLRGPGSGPCAADAYLRARAQNAGGLPG